jgi:hypothetical protein
MGYVPADAPRDGNYRPFSLFRRFFRETPSDDQPGTGNVFQGQDPVIDDAEGDATQNHRNDLDTIRLNTSDEDQVV